MFEKQSRRAEIIWGTVLVVALSLEGWVLYYVQTSWTRLHVGLILLAIIMLASSRLEIFVQARARLAGRKPSRRFRSLRSQMDQFIAEARRLNWLAVDLEREIRDPASVVEQMDAIENRLLELVKRIRAEAGR